MTPRPPVDESSVHPRASPDFPPRNGEERRTCPRCGESRAVLDFAVDRSKASRRKSWCRACDSARALRYYYANREAVLARIAARRKRSGRLSVRNRTMRDEE